MCVWSASPCLISKKTRWFKNRSSIRLLSMRVLKMSKVLLRSRRLTRRLVGAFRKRPIKLKTALVKARSFSAVTCDLETRQQELQRKTPPITLDSMHSTLRCAALPQGTCFRCRPNQGLSVKHHYGSVFLTVMHSVEKKAYRTKSVSGPIIHSFRNGYLVLWWSSSHTRPSPHFSGREASSALMPYRSLSRSTSASVGISRSVSAIVFGHSTCR